MTIYQTQRRIPTMAGAIVEVARDPSGRAVVVKRAQTDSAAASLAACARHLRRLLEIDDIAMWYPSVLSYDDGVLVLPYYEHGSLDAAGAHDRGRFVELVNQALDVLIRVSGRETMQGTDGSLDGVIGARAFWRTQLRSRLDRLAKTGADLRKQPFGAIVDSLDSGLLDTLVNAAATRPLALAAHGDFGLNNVLLDHPTPLGPGFRFIDLRGQTPWAAGLPWWDPMLDLGTLIAFHCHIEPALGVRDGIAVEGPHDRATLTPDEIFSGRERSPVMRQWADDDPQWRLRTQLGVVTRILGSVSTQLTSAPKDREARAEKVTRLLDAAWKELVA